MESEKVNLVPSLTKKINVDCTINTYANESEWHMLLLKYEWTPWFVFDMPLFCVRLIKVPIYVFTTSLETISWTSGMFFFFFFF